MSNWLAHQGSPRSGSGRKFATENLKRCPVCGSVNARQNYECVTCRWHGRFDTDPRAIEEGLDELLDRCPELSDSLLDRSHKTRKRIGLVGILRWLFWGRLDLRI